MYKRAYFQSVKERIEEPRMFIQVIAGPRQVGKSTLVSQVLQEISISYTSVSADDVPTADAGWISDIWESARIAQKLKKEKEHLLVIDEIQKLDNWSETVKKEWDKDSRENNNIKVVLLGSSRLLLKKGLTESLAGRFEIIRMGHWAYEEMQEAFGWDINQYVYFGGDPGTARLIKDEERWRIYVKDALIETTISKDVLMLTQINKPALLRQVFELGCMYSGQILSLTKMLGQLQDAGNTTTISNYLNLLDECGLLASLSKYAGDEARTRASVPKFQVYNSALMNAYNPLRFKAARTDTKEWGRLFESAVGAHLVNGADKGNYKVFYWREGNEEVDYIIKKDGKLVAIEVKSGRRSTNSGLSRFRETFHPHLAFVVGTNGMGMEDFLKSDVTQLF